MLLEQLAQDVRYALRGMVTNRMFTGLAALSLALGIGANTAIYSFMDAILLRSLPVADPASLVVVKWHSGPVNFGSGDPFVLHSIDGSTYRGSSGVAAAIFPFPAFERLREASSPVLSSLFAHKPAGGVNVVVKGEAELVQGQYVSGGFFGGLAVVPAAGRLIHRDDDRAGAAPIAVLSAGYSQRRFGDVDRAIGQAILVNGVTFTVVGVAPPEFFGVDPASAPQIYLPMRTSVLIQPDGERDYVDPNYYWVEMMGRLRPGVDLPGAQAALATPFAQWVASTATSDRERANLPVLRLEAGAAGLDSLRRQVLEAAVCAAGDGGADPGHRVREHGQSAAGAVRHPGARDRRAAQSGCRPLAHRPAAAHGKRAAGDAQRCPRHPHRRGRHGRVDAVARQRPGVVHAPRRTELARAAASRWRCR